MIPEHYPDWRHCIETVCGIPLTPDYIRERIAALADPHEFHTQRFVDCYGDAHLQRVRAWFAQALTEAEHRN
jgi:hypothetical protein